MRRPLRAASLLAVVAAAAAVWFLLAPLQLGGSTSYAVVYGSSMEPHLHRGDLVVLRSKLAYVRGDVVGYRSRELHRNVLHRIVATHGDRFVFKGDNNAFLDPERPRRDQLFGREWVVVPQAGALLERLRTPRNAAILAGLAVLLLLGAGPNGAVRRRRRRARPERIRPRIDRTARAAGLLAGGLLAGGGVAVALAGALAVSAFREPAQRLVTDPERYVQRGAFSWTARAPVGDVYQASSLRPHDPVFLRLVHRIDVGFSYSVRSRRPAAFDGSGELAAVLSDGKGWRRRFALTGRRRLSGGTVGLHGTLDLRALQGAVRRFETETGEHNVSYRVTLAPRVRVHGVAAGRELRDSFAPALTFDLDALRLQIAAPPAAGANTLVRMRGAASTETVRGVVRLLGWSGDVAAARRLALAVGGAGALAALTGGLLLARRRRGDEVASIERRYGDLIVRVAAGSRPALAERRVTDVDALARLAQRYDRLILHEARPGRDSFLVEDAGFVYRYDVGADADATAELPLDALRNGNGRLRTADR